MEKSDVINEHYLKESDFAFNEVAIFRQSTEFLWKPIWPKRTQNALRRSHDFVHKIIETLWCYKWPLLNSLEFFLMK